MIQRIYDSRLQDVVDFVPLREGEVGMYVCGPTVQSSPHIGHLRSALAYDQLRRWLAATGHTVTMIRNVTDIDDKILEHARIGQEAGGSEEWWALAYRIELEFNDAYRALGVQAPTYEPRATANVAQMIEIIELLIERGHAYQASDGTASVYFDTGSWAQYGALTRQQRDQMEDAADSEPVGKRDPRDFALWKSHREGEPISASWSSPWGRGRPGWHIECSAMATRYLGTEFDIHGGGLDLRFPHHENELAQSNAAGHGFARHWIHNGLVNTGGQKMSKSLGNSLFAHELLALTRPIVLRYFLGSAHYRSVLEFTPEHLEEAGAAFGRIEGFLERADRQLGNRMPQSYEGTATIHDVPSAFASAMLDDFSVPQALAVLHSTVRSANIALESGDLQGAETGAREIAAMLDVFGIDPRSVNWQESASQQQNATGSALDALVNSLIETRNEARLNKDFATSDLIRDQLTQAGVELEDGPNETRWSVS